MTLASALPPGVGSDPMEPMSTRTVLFTGKGGVGKTTMAAATAVGAAKRGQRVLLVSTDPAHSLADVLGLTRYGSIPTAVIPGLEAVDLDAHGELFRRWDAIRSYLQELLGSTPFDHLDADDVLGMPGLDEILVLARLEELISSGAWDLIVVDGAASGESLRLLMLPDVVGWWVERLFDRPGVDGWLMRRLQRAAAVPVPSRSAVGSVTDLCAGLSRLRAYLQSPQAMARIVTTSERVVVAESRRTIGHLSVVGLALDAIIVNRIQGEYRPGCTLTDVSAAIGVDPSVALPAPLLADEPIGVTALADLATEVYGSRHPGQAAPGNRQVAPRWTDDRTRLTIPLPGIEADSLVLRRTRDGLVIGAGSYRRRIPMEGVTHHVTVKQARYDEGVLTVELERGADADRR